MKTDP